MTTLGLCLSLIALLAMTAFAGQWTGYVSETKCGARHADGSEASIKCVTGCVKAGAKPVLVVEGKVVPIANGDKVMDHLGKKVTVTGDMHGNTLTIDTVKSAD